ncbi:hypothetical protein EYF80_064405 [Liparis tanakae]|uniref:Uncharacterized protein n=1 Tax=Liparis tanakae TaxID=230148 RepID=A0A4Z2EAA0_9TELE|nr:hypothetical protein EYF80_064405 [Liparis tanakae]
MAAEFTGTLNHTQHLTTNTTPHTETTNFTQPLEVGDGLRTSPTAVYLQRAAATPSQSRPLSRLRVITYPPLSRRWECRITVINFSQQREGDSSCSDGGETSATLDSTARGLRGYKIRKHDTAVEM